MIIGNQGFTGEMMVEIRSAHVLVVDDDFGNTAMIEAFLLDCNYEVSIATNSSQVVDMATTLLPDVILMDILMPKINGFDLAKLLHQNPRTKDIPIIFVSALTEHNEISEAFANYAKDYITKPIDLHELLASIRETLDL